MTALSKRAGRWGEQAPGFNAAVADVVYGRIMKCATDEEAALYSAMLLGGMLQHDLFAQGEQLAKAARDVVAARVDDMSRNLARTALSKSRAGDQHGGDVAVEALGQLITLAKAFSGDAFSPSARAERARQQHRDLQSGQFVVEHHDLSYSSPDQGFKELDDRQASALGIKKPTPVQWKNMSRAQRMLYQQAYSQVAALVAPYAHVGDKGVLHLNYGDGTRETHPIPKPDARIPISTESKVLTSAQVSVVPPLYGDMDLGDALATLGHPDAYNAVTSGALNRQHLAEHTDAVRTPGSQDQFIPSARGFRLLHHGSKLLADTLGDTAPIKLRLALKVGEHVGTYGPEAQRVIGPTADKLAYRYRGTEKAPDKGLTNAVASIGNDARLQGPDKREFMVHGVETDDGWRASPVLDYFRHHLPKAEYNTLQRKAGTIPPSQGVIIDKTGKLTTEAVGYSDDHYLPFNLKNLSKLKGGEYIRTRSWGGPTTEDIYTGLVSRARSLTVVSHNGTYTVEFDDTLRGKRRFNDKAARMVGRYGHLLDAVRNGKVTTATIDPTRMAEIKETANAARNRDYYPDEYDAEVERLVDAERRNPKLSQAKQAEVIEDFLATTAGKRRTADGREQSVEDMTRDLAAHRAEQDFAAYKGSDTYRDERAAAAPLPNINGLDEAEKNEAGRQWRARMQNFDRVKLAGMTDARLSELEDPDPVVAGTKLAQALGLQGQLDQRLQRESERNRTNLKELELNGPGYAIALEALQEQFPYYIARVEYHPWAEGAPGGFDTGYVRPGRLRPQKAYSGYFDEDLGGKVHADSTRHQRREGLKRYEVKQRKTDGAKTTAARGPVSDEAKQKLKLNAAMELVEHLKQARFNDADQLAMVSDTDPERDAKHAAVAGKSISEVAAALPSFKANPVYRDLAQLVLGDSDELRKQPEALYRKLDAALPLIKNQKLLNLDEKKVRAYKQGGDAKPRTFDDPSAALDAVDDEWELRAAPEYNAGTKATSEAIEGVYERDPAIRAAVNAKLLPPYLQEPNFDAKAGELHRSLRSLSGEIDRADAGVTAGRPEGERDFKPRVEALVKAKQLRRRHQEALDREAEEARQLEAERPIQQTLVMHENQARELLSRDRRDS